MSAVRVGGTGATSQSGNTYTFDGVAIDLSDGTTTAVTKLVEIEGENLPTSTQITLVSAGRASVIIRELIYGDPSTMKGANVTITPNANVTSCAVTLKLGDLATIILNCVVTQPSASVTGVILNGSTLTPDSGTKTYRGSITLDSTTGTATLVVNGTNLDRMATPVVSGEQNCSVQVTQTASTAAQKTYTLAISNVTAGVNGGATITLADASLILSVVAPAPTPTIESVYVGNILLNHSGNAYQQYYTTTGVDIEEAFSGSKVFEVPFRIVGTNVGNIELYDSMVFSNDRGVNIKTDYASYVMSVVDGDLYIVVRGTIPQNDVPDEGVCSYGARVNVLCGADVYVLEYGYVYTIP